MSTHDSTPAAGACKKGASEDAFPAPSHLGRWTLPSQRRTVLRNEFLRRIDQEAPAASPAVRRPRFVRPAVVLPAAALAVTAALLTAVPGDHGHRAPDTMAQQADAAAVTWLNRAATVSSRTAAPAVRDDEFVYVRSLVRENDGRFDGPVHLGPEHRREVWIAQGPGVVTRIGTMRYSGPGAVMPGQYLPIEASTGQAPGIERPTYAWLADLPRDPEALLSFLRGQVRPIEGESVDHAVFDAIGDLLAETIKPPKTAAALYHAAARLPGVTVTNNATDAAGRSGIGITFHDGTSATRNEWIFDRTTLAYLGDRSYVTGHNGRPDVLFGITAVLQRDVVDKSGQRPAGTSMADTSDTSGMSEAS